MANPNIFSQYLKPPKSIAEFGAELDTAEANRLSLADARRKGIEADAAVAEKNALRAALAAGGDLSTQDAQARLLQRAGPSALPVLKSLEEVRGLGTKRKLDEAHTGLYSAQTSEHKTKDEAAKYDLAQKKINESIRDVIGFKTPQDAIAAIHKTIIDHETTPEIRQKFLELLPTVPKTDAEMPAWKMERLQRLLTAEQQITANRGHTSTVNGQIVTTDQFTGQQRGAVIVPPQAPTPLQKAQERLTTLQADDIDPNKAAVTTPLPSQPSPQGSALPAPKRQLSQQEEFAIEKTATNLGISPSDLKAVIQYETAGTFSPNIMGGDGGRYLGLIQFGPEERQRYGANPNQTFEQQMVAVENYLRDRGVKPGHDISKLYATISGGNPNVPLTARDSNGTIAQHVANITGQSPMQEASAQGVRLTPKQIREERIAQIRANNQSTQQRERDAERERQRIATEDRKIAEELPKAKLQVDTVDQSLTKLENALTELKSHRGLGGITGGILGRVGSVSDASTAAQAKYDQVVSTIFVTAVRALKDAGATLGSVSNTEGDKVQNTLAALKQAQPKGDLQNEIDKAITQIKESRDLVKRSYKDKYGRIEAAGGPGSAGRPAAASGVKFLGFE